jgi:methylated-DNA-protein-cysteine methyltransferase-like protein
LNKAVPPEKLKVIDNSKNYNFFQNVWDVVRMIPSGRVSTYGAIANYLGVKSSARLVGWAMNASFSVTPKVPAQRVVNRNGMLTGKVHFNPPTLMEELLKKEGIQVENDKVVDFLNVYWDPNIEL